MMYIFWNHDNSILLFWNVILGELVDITDNGVRGPSSESHSQLQFWCNSIIVIVEHCTDCLVTCQVNHDCLCSGTMNALHESINLLFHSHGFPSFQKLDMCPTVSIVIITKSEVPLWAIIDCQTNGLSGFLSSALHISSSFKVGHEVKPCLSSISSSFMSLN